MSPIAYELFFLFQDIHNVYLCNSVMSLELKKVTNRQTSIKTLVKSTTLNTPHLMLVVTLFFLMGMGMG